MPLAATYTWEDCPIEELRAFAVSHATSHKTCINADVPQVFKDWVSSIVVGKLGYTVDHWAYWVSDLEPLEDPESEWMAQFPHAHQWDGMTLVLYLQAPDEGGELVVLDQDLTTELHRFQPVTGTGVLLLDHAVHGVKAIHGRANRVTMIAGAYPYPSGSTKCRCADQNWVRVTN